MNSEYNKSLPASVYAWMVPAIREVARGHGYAIGLHGSMARDLDLIAVPWMDNAATTEVLVEAVMKAVGGQFAPHDMGFDRNPCHKPHGRRAWSIYFSGMMFYIDLSVMPLITNAHKSAPLEDTH
jgi:hypothetical protein